MIGSVPGGRRLKRLGSVPLADPREGAEAVRFTLRQAAVGFLGSACDADDLDQTVVIEYSVEYAPTSGANTKDISLKFHRTGMARAFLEPENLRVDLAESLLIQLI